VLALELTEFTQQLPLTSLHCPAKMAAELRCQRPLPWLVAAASSDDSTLHRYRPLPWLANKAAPHALPFSVATATASPFSPLVAAPTPFSAAAASLPPSSLAAAPTPFSTAAASSPPSSPASASLPAAPRPRRPLPWHAKIAAQVHNEQSHDGALAQDKLVHHNAPVHAEQLHGDDTPMRDEPADDDAPVHAEQLHDNAPALNEQRYDDALVQAE
jgi:hypothetical protein